VPSEAYWVGLRYTLEPSWGNAIAIENDRAGAGLNGGDNNKNDLAFVPECDLTDVNVIPCSKVIEAATQIGHQLTTWARNFTDDISGDS
jgi:hypothetical protein